MSMSQFLTSTVCTFVVYTIALPYDNEYGPEYGNEWIYYLADNGTTYVMNFSTLPTDSRSMLFGDAYFYLYTRQNKVPEQLIIPEDNSTIYSAYFNASNEIKAITHGWLSDGNTQWLQNMKDAFLRLDDFNVIIIGWGELAKNPIYPWSAFSTRYVGKRMASLISALGRTYQIEDRSIHLIGHSLGAQIMGYAGMFSKQRVQRVTGLDPARPLFELPPMGSNFRLEKSDAEFVDIIHTCGGIYGYKYSHGHADYYPNNGKPRQPGCEGKQQMIEACSHSRAYEFFTESIEYQEGFLAHSCDNWKKYDKGECQNSSQSYMGYSASTDSQGDFYLRTANESKYSESNDN